MKQLSNCIDYNISHVNTFKMKTVSKSVHITMMSQSYIIPPFCPRVKNHSTIRPWTCTFAENTHGSLLSRTHAFTNICITSTAVRLCRTFARFIHTRYTRTDQHNLTRSAGYAKMKSINLKGLSIIWVLANLTFAERVNSIAILNKLYICSAQLTGLLVSTAPRRLGPLPLPALNNSLHRIPFGNPYHSH